MYQYHIIRRSVADRDLPTRHNAMTNASRARPVAAPAYGNPRETALDAKGLKETERTRVFSFLHTMDASHSTLRKRSKKRHESDTAVVQHDHKTRVEGDGGEIKETLAETVEIWRDKVHKVRMC